jgi:DNA polymerase-3 subunit delta
MAKRRADQLNRALKEQLAPVYLITGDEPLLVQEACDSIRKAARKEGFSEREIYHTDGNFNWSQLLQSANSLSLFADKKLIEVRLHNGKPGDAGSKAIVEYCQAHPADTLLVIVAPKLEKRVFSSAWVKALDSLGDIVTIWPVSAAQLPHWIDQRLKSVGLQADAQAIDILAAKVEGNLLAAAQEIEKLKLLAPGKVVDSQLMTSVVVDSARYDVFTLADKALHGDARSAVKALNGLRGEGTEPMVILWALTRELRTLYNIKHMVQQGQPFDLAAKQNGIWENRKAIVRQAVNRCKLHQLAMLIRQASLADRTVKGLAAGDVWPILLDLVLGLSGTQSLSAPVQKLALK